MAVTYMLREGDEDRFKVGHADDLAARLRQHHTSNPRLAPFRVIEAGSTADATCCESYLKGILQARRRPGSEETYELPADEAWAAADEAERYLAEDMPAQAEAEAIGVESDGTVLKPGDAEWEAWRRLMAAREAWFRAGAWKAAEENRLKLWMGPAGEAEGLARWRTRRRTRFDTDAFAAAHPDLHREFVVPAPDRPFKPL